MKHINLLTLPALASIASLMVGCGSFNQPLGGGDGANPLDAPGGATAQEDPYGPSFAPGTFLQTVSPNTAFFMKFPKEEDQPNKTLPDYTDVKVISAKGSYVKVEVVDTGEVGYVPSVMLGEKRSPNEVPVTPGMGEVPVTPGAAADVPPIAPDPEVPGIQDPELVDPSMPAE